MPANLYALGAIALWALLASLGVSLKHLPPFLLTGVALLIGSVLALPFVVRDRTQWKIPAATLALGVYGLFGFHFLLFIALRHAPAVEANLVNYLWPLFMVVLAPLRRLPSWGHPMEPPRAAGLGAMYRRWARPLSGPVIHC
jgi:drug/metabolite transporter (DMT)-like permease